MNPSEFLTPEVSQTVADGKAALLEAIAAIRAGLDTAIHGVSGDIPKLSADGVAAAESIVSKLAGGVPLLSQIIGGVIAMESGQIKSAVANLDTKGAAEIALFEARLDSLPL